MKPDIHPKYVDAVVTCACGATYHVRSTKPSYRVEVCGACHPFYTGNQRVVDTGGRVERFRRKYAAYQAAQAGEADEPEAAVAEEPQAEPAEPSAKELLTKVAEARKGADRKPAAKPRAKRSAEREEAPAGRA